MQLSLALPGPSLIVEIDDRLRAAYGGPPDFARIDPVSQLVQSLLSSKTLDAVSTAAFLALAHRYKQRRDASWDLLRLAAPAAIYPQIRAVHHAEVKAVQLPQALMLIYARSGGLDLDFLADWPVATARYWLTALPGVGPKVSAAVLNFSTLNRRVLVCDTHGLRVARRLGLSPPGRSDEVTYRMVERQIPDDWTAETLSDHHWLMKTHGQRRCHATVPLCAGCPLDDICADRKSARRRATRR
jgi:endonuclease-3